MLSPLMKSKVKALFDKFWSGGIANPLTAIEQISYLLFMKRLDEGDLKRKADAEWVEQPYKSIFEGKFQLPNSTETVERETLRWGHFRHFEGGEMLAHVQSKVFPFIKSLGSEDQPFARHMKDAVFILPEPSLLVEAIGIIDSIYEEIERERQEGQTFHDTQGDIYEFLLSEIASAGKNGQFRTPRHIIQLICALVDPKLGDEVVDLAAGTAGFLLGAYQHILTQHTSPEHQSSNGSGIPLGLLGDKLTDERQWQALREQTLYGYDFDATMVRIGLMNLMLHGIDRPNFDYANTLSKKFGQENHYSVALGNPPFKGSLNKGDINENLSLKTTKTELLFVNKFFNVLRLGGKAGVIVPDGVLFGSSNAHRELRKMLIEKCELQGVVSMPSGVFKPYAGVSTAVLIFVKGGTTEKIWFYDMEHDGYSLDDKRQKVPENDLPDILFTWQNRHSPEFVAKREKRLAELRAQIEPLKVERLRLQKEVSRLKFEHAIASDENEDAQAALEADERRLAELHEQVKPLQDEINQLTRQFWVSRERVEANKYDLSASRYRQIEQDESFYEEPQLTLDRLLQLEGVMSQRVKALKGLIQ